MVTGAIGVESWTLQNTHSAVILDPASVPTVERGTAKSLKTSDRYSG